jgi:phasin family protein
MSNTPEQFTAANLSNVQALEGLAKQAFAGFEKLVELNLATSKALLRDAFSHTSAVLGAKDAQEWLSLQAGLLQPMAEKSAAYGQNLYTITTGTGAEFSKTMEARFSEGQAAFNEAIENFLRNAPVGSETVVAAFKSAVSASKSVIESAQNSAKKAAEVVESNFSAATHQAASAATSSSRKR